MFRTASPTVRFLIAVCLVCGTFAAHAAQVKLTEDVRVAFRSNDGKVTGSRVVRAGSVVEVLEVQGNILRVRDRVGVFTVNTASTNARDVLSTNANGSIRAPTQREVFLAKTASYEKLVGAFRARDTTARQDEFGKSLAGKAFHCHGAIFDIVKEKGNYSMMLDIALDQFRLSENAGRQLRSELPVVVTGTIDKFMVYLRFDVPTIRDGIIQRGVYYSKVRDVTVYLDDIKGGRLIPIARRKRVDLITR
jgi:hypothetical protein